MTRSSIAGPPPPSEPLEFPDPGPAGSDSFDEQPQVPPHGDSEESIPAAGSRVFPGGGDGTFDEDVGAEAPKSAGAPTHDMPVAAFEGLSRVPMFETAKPGTDGLHAPLDANAKGTDIPDEGPHLHPAGGG